MTIELNLTEIVAILIIYLVLKWIFGMVKG